MKSLKTKISCILLAASALVATSCSKDYLNTSPTSFIDNDKALSNVKNYKSIINGLAKLMTVQHSGFGYGFCGENAIMTLYENYPGPNYNFNFYANGWSVIFNQTYHTRANTVYAAYPWYYYYSIIAGANTLLDKIDGAEGDEKQKAFYKASALTFRAYGYEKLIHYYCVRWKDSNNGSAQGVPLRLKSTSDGLKCSTMAEVYQQIYKDLDEAMALYGKSEMDRVPAEVWMPNINVAHAIYARAALYKEDYAKAKEHAIEAYKGFPLTPGNGYNNGFCKPTPEWIWGSFGGEQEQNWYWAYGVNYACNGYMANNDNTGAGSITRELINRIPNTDCRKKLFLTEDKFPGFNMNDPKVVHPNFGIFLDEKLKAAAQKYIDETRVKDYDMPYQAGTFYLGSHLKFYVFAGPGVSYLPIIRASEMVLIKAEACYFLNDMKGAQDALIELNKTTGRNPEYTCTKTGEALFNEITDYREVELWGEGFAWSDYKRWKKTIVRKTMQDGGNTFPSVAVTIAPDDKKTNNWTWVIPEQETLYNDQLHILDKKP